MSLKEKWSVSDFAIAMEGGVRSQANRKYIKTSSDKLMFNGFWRNGDKSNVCIWLTKATWADAKTGDGGGCKEFAKVAFNLSLPEFMERFGHSSIAPLPASPIKDSRKHAHQTISINDVWSKLVEDKNNSSDSAEHWLKKVRGFDSPRETIGSGFLSLEKRHLSLFNSQHKNFILQRFAKGPQLIVPIRSTISSKVENLFFRALSNVDINDKSRLLPGCDGWTEKDGSPRAFGFPHLIHDFPKLVLCEGMADYFATECLLGCGANNLALGAANASALNNWANWLAKTGFKGRVTILYQLDKDQSGKISSLGVGQSKASHALKTLLENKIPASLFQWPSFLRKIDISKQHPGDIADVCKIYGSKAISEQFMATLNEVN